MSNELEDIIRQLCVNGPINYKRFIDTCLYHPEHGYYRKKSKRIGRNSGCDFYTSQSLGNVFSKIVIDAIESLIKQPLKEYHFIEIGSEPYKPFLDNTLVQKFKGITSIKPGDPIELKNTPTIIFSNEWLDALPFHRMIYLNNKWKERGIGLCDNNHLTDKILKTFSSEIKNFKYEFPKDSSEGYELDFSPLIIEQIENIFKQDWSGLFLAFDYGKSWSDLTQRTPNGTARTYRKHNLGTNLLKNIGNTDITADICWDFVEDTIKKYNHNMCKIESQESFFIKHSSKSIKEIIEKDRFKFSKDKLTLMELLHPGNMGQRFQAIYAIRN